MNTIKELLNFKIDRVQFSAQVFVVGAILSATFFLLLIDSAKTYRADVSILVSAKSQIAVRQQEQLIGSIVEFTKTLAFYDRLLAFNPDVRDVAAGLSPDQRKTAWNEMFSITRADDNATVLKISIVARREADAQQLASKTARTLFDTVAFYYDIKNDVDLRIIDGPISESRVSQWQGLLLLSIAGGFAFATSLHIIFFGGKKGLGRRRDSLKKNFFFEFKKSPELPAEKELESFDELYQSQQAEQPFAFEQKTPYNEQAEKSSAEKLNYDEKFQEMKKITKQFEPDKYPNFPEMPIEQQWTDSVPDNLPIAEDSYQEPDETINEQVEAKISEATEEVVPGTTKEPTPEELKKRLNELLRGEF